MSHLALFLIYFRYINHWIEANDLLNDQSKEMKWENINKVKTKSIVSGQRQEEKHSLLGGKNRSRMKTCSNTCLKYLYCRAEFQDIIQIFSFFIFLLYENLDYVTYKWRFIWKSIVYEYYFHNIRHWKYGFWVQGDISDSIRFIFKLNYSLSASFQNNKLPHL